jgi:hypothetical protein
LKSLVLSGFEHLKRKNPALQPKKPRAAWLAPKGLEMWGFSDFATSW